MTLALAAAASTFSCGGNDTAETKFSFGSEATEVTPTAETEPVPPGGDADDPAIWIDPDNPARSTIIGTDKLGGLAVYDLAGNELQYLPDGRLNNVDLRSGVLLGGIPSTIVVAGDRNTRRMRVYKVDPATRLLVPADARTLSATLNPMGVCMYRSAASGKLYVVVNSDTGRVEQWELFDNGLGLIDAQLVRSFAVGSETEGCVADDELGHLYISEEDVGVWKYGAEPDAGATRSLMDATGSAGHITADAEGITILYGDGGRGYLIVSSQGNSTYAVYRRQGSNAYVRSFKIRLGAGIDAVSSTDGIDATLTPLGPAFPNGIFVAQDDVNCTAAVYSCGLAPARANQNFKLVPWQSLGLPTP